MMATRCLGIKNERATTKFLLIGLLQHRIFKKLLVQWMVNPKESMTGPETKCLVVKHSETADHSRPTGVKFRIICRQPHIRLCRSGSRREITADDDRVTEAGIVLNFPLLETG